MQSTELPTAISERVRELDKEVSVMREILERNIATDEEFKKEIRDKLDIIQGRNIKVDAFIESEMEARKERAAFWREQKVKSATAGFITAITLIGYVIWYAVVHWVQNGAK